MSSSPEWEDDDLFHEEGEQQWGEPRTVCLSEKPSSRGKILGGFSGKSPLGPSFVLQVPTQRMDKAVVSSEWRQRVSGLS